MVIGTMPLLNTYLCILKATPWGLVARKFLNLVCLDLAAYGGGGGQGNHWREKKIKPSLNQQQQISHPPIPALRVEVMANSEHISLSTLCAATSLRWNGPLDHSGIRTRVYWHMAEGVVNSLSRPPTAPPRLGLRGGVQVRNMY